MKVFTVGYTFASLRSRDYRLLWLAQLSTSMGQWMDQMTRGWLMYELTGSALQLGLATALRGLPLLFFGILAGAVADRSNRKSQLIVAQVTNAVLNVILASGPAAPRTALARVCDGFCWDSAGVPATGAPDPDQ